MFSMPFSWWWPFIRPAPLAPFPFSPAAFFPFFPPWNNKGKLMTWANWCKYLYSARLTETINPCNTGCFYLSFSCVCAPSIRIFREVCVWGESSICIPGKQKKASKWRKSPQIRFENFNGETHTYWVKGKSDGISGAAIIFVTSSGNLQLMTGLSSLENTRRSRLHET